MVPKIFATIGIVVVNISLWVFFILSSTVLMVGSAVIFLVTYFPDPNRRILHAYSCFWASLYLWVNPFWRLRKKGLHHAERGKTYVVVSNHQSMTDILIVYNTFLHFKWVAKQSVFNLPLLGWNMRLNGYVPIKRGNDLSREKCLDSCREWLAKGSSVLFFPEGTRTRDGKLLPFKVGAFRLAVESGHDILPIVIRGSLNALPVHSFLLHRKTRITLEVLPPVSVLSYQGNPSGVESLMNHIRVMMKSKLNSGV